MQSFFKELTASFDLQKEMKITKNHDSNSFVVYNEDDDNLKSIFKEKINSLPFSIQKKNQFFTKKKTILRSGIQYF